KNDLHEAAASCDKVHAGYLGNRLGKEFAVTNHPQAAVRLADNDAAVGQKCKRVGIGKAFGYRDHTNFVVRRIEILWRRIHRRSSGLTAAALTGTALAALTLRRENRC